ncbi:uncharacterized protein [Cicer arietinum]|uniref:Branchpoint-bridging protein-like isoform X2 n=1 Tax=Cicer arietinum TaxID=3827 RepID=A0A3Q7YBB2_CICAR|nr:branchpoint-bridging protein-like isoform X2 [Cicer arietinum]
MGIIQVEFCLISAHGLHHSTSLWKRHWYAVGWIDHDSKYCTKVDDSGNANPVWRTKFAIPVDDSALNIRDLALNVEVYSIDPIFFKEKLHGSTTVGLKEFLVKQLKNSEVSMPKQKEVQSYQLRKRKSSKSRGFIDILICISNAEKELSSHTGSKEGTVLLDYGDNNQWTAQERLRQAYPQKQPKNHAHTNVPDSYSVPLTTTIYSDQYVGEQSYHAAAGPSYQPPRTRTPPPPSPPSNVGYIPTFLPRNDGLPPSFTDIPPSREEHGQKVPPGVALEITAEALAAGTVIFGDDFLPGFDVIPS